MPEPGPEVVCWYTPDPQQRPGMVCAVVRRRDFEKMNLAEPVPIRRGRGDIREVYLGTQPLWYSTDGALVIVQVLPKVAKQHWKNRPLFGNCAVCGKRILGKSRTGRVFGICFKCGLKRRVDRWREEKELKNPW